MDLEFNDWFIQYIYAMYFILMTMTTIGYGDMVGRNPIETFYTLFMMVFFVEVNVDD